MTNREWLESLSDEELAHFIDNAHSDNCYACAFQSDTCAGIYDCLNGIKYWLQSEHKDED